ncbi:MAG: cupin domain-containing protein [Devosia sp.]
MSDPAPEVLVFEDDGTFPNSRLPVLIYCAPGMAIAEAGDAMEALFRRNDWEPLWRDTVFDYHHYHSTAHEALGVIDGEATLQLGGPKGQYLHVAKGDIIVIPAGVAHRRVVASAAFELVGAYPRGQEDWDVMRGLPADRPGADIRIGRLALPTADPVGGTSGALVKLWR